MKERPQHPTKPANEVILSGQDLRLPHLLAIVKHRAKVVLSPEAMKKVAKARQCIEERLLSNETFYGINTGFGFLAEVRIPNEKVGELQFNLIRSHACGVGEPLAEDVVRAVLALRIQTMLRGNSGVRMETVQLMAEFLNRNIIPVIPSKGSVGASGDLAPLAHLALSLIGEGHVFYKGSKMVSAEAFQMEGLTPLIPAAKEGLCLINGTQVMTAIGLLECARTMELLKVADIVTAMTLDATRGTATAYREEIHAVRPYVGQKESAQNLRTLLADDAIRLSHHNCTKVQDAYSLRCVPQVHGAARNAFKHVLETLELEANSSTDNPLVFAETNEILSGGNFHGEPVAMVLDYLAIAVSEIASISERRIDKLVNPHMSGLPAFLAEDSGLNSGYMIPHVVAAALVSENKIFAHPACVDNIPTNAEKEDHVSMGQSAALKLRTIVQNTGHVLAIEMLAAAEGLEFHKPLEGGVGVRAAYRWVRNQFPPMKKDRSLSMEIESIAASILSGEVTLEVEKELEGGCLL
jgi:histidine ammonia-lyase